jgi:hypothetical protein
LEGSGNGKQVIENGENRTIRELKLKNIIKN